jgi:hypothetical protein
MSPALKVKILEGIAIALIATGLTVFEQSVRRQVKLENSGDVWVEAATMKESASDGISGSA